MRWSRGGISSGYDQSPPTDARLSKPQVQRHLGLLSFNTRQRIGKNIFFFLFHHPVLATVT